MVLELTQTTLTGGLKLSLADIQAIRGFRVGDDDSENRLLSALREHIQHKTRVITDQTILCTDIHGFAPFRDAGDLTTLEGLLTHYEILATTVAKTHAGVVRSIVGDSCLLTFLDTGQAL